MNATVNPGKHFVALFLIQTRNYLNCSKMKFCVEYQLRKQFSRQLIILLTLFIKGNGKNSCDKENNKLVPGNEC